MENVFLGIGSGLFFGLSWWCVSEGVDRRSVFLTILALPSMAMGAVLGLAIFGVQGLLAP